MDVKHRNSGTHYHKGQTLLSFIHSKYFKHFPTFILYTKVLKVEKLLRIVGTVVAKDFPHGYTHKVCLQSEFFRTSWQKELLRL